jgi:hypothetical protein
VSAARERRSRAFWPAVAVGWVVMAVGARGVLMDAADTVPRRWLVLFLGSAVVHDLVVAPAVILVGWAVARAAPPWARAPVQAGLLTSGAVALFALPFVAGYGRQPANPSALPLDYGRGLAVVLAVVWIACGAWAFKTRRSPRASHHRLEHDGGAGLQGQPSAGGAG